MASQLNYGVGHTAVAKPDEPIGQATSKLAQDHSGAPTAAQEIKVAVETRESGRVDDGAVQKPSVDLPALSLEALKNLTAIEKGFEESETIAVDLPGLSLEELITFEAIEGTSSYKWKPTTALSVDLPALSLEGLRNLTVSNEDFKESETPERIVVNSPTSPEHGGGSSFIPFNLSSITVKLPAPLVSFAPDVDFDETEGDGIFAVLSDREWTTNNPTSTVTDTATVPVGNAIEGGPGDDTLTGTSGNDTIFGYGGNDTLIGLAGNDTLDGGAGTDTADYSGSSTAVTVNLATGTGSGGDAQGDTLISIENLNGSNNDDSLTGDGNDNTLDGGAGNDTLIGGDGNDRLRGRDGDDTLDGGAGADDLEGDDGNDTLEGGAGADALDGDHGNDTASYAGSSAAVDVNLSTGTASGGDATGDTLTDIENLTGSGFADTLTGDAGNNILIGGGGADQLFGGDGNDKLDGDGGNDKLKGGAGNDTVDGGAGNDTLRGGTGDDILVWDSLDLTIDGGAGSDTLRVDSGNADLTAFAGTIAGIEIIDLEADTGANTVTLAAQDVLDVSDTDTVTITGDAGDSIEAGTGWTDGGIAGGFHTYTQGLATLLVDTDITVNADITA